MRAHIVGETTVQIPLTRGLTTILDRSDYDATPFLHRSWLAQATSTPDKFYAARQQWMPDEKRYRYFYIHRIIMGAPPELEVDHRDGNSLDNRRRNLRICNHQQNTQNRGNTRQRRYKGTVYMKEERRWRAEITLDWHCIHLGCFATEREAALAYNEAAARLFGEFAKLNDMG